MKRNAAKQFLLVFMVSIFALFCIVSSSSWSAEKYPSRSVELACGQAAGGGVDIFNRIMTKYFEKYLGVPFVPVNKPGPAQMMAAVYVAKSKPDGYTIGHMGNQIITAEMSGEASGYSMDELRPICQVGMQGLVIAVTPDSPWKTWQDFVDYAKKNPGTKYGHHGVGSGPHDRMELLNKYLKLQLQGVPFKGEAELLPMLLGKHIPICPLSPTAARPQLEAGKIRVLLSFEKPSENKLPNSIPFLDDLYGANAMPDLPTSIFLWAPKKTPDDVVKLLDQTYAKMMKDPGFLDECNKNNVFLNYADSDTVVKKILPERIKMYRGALEALGKLKK
jgi:tripartite-type tricarboxylate transporter receptor subunit TctC